MQKLKAHWQLTTLIAVIFGIFVLKLGVIYINRNVGWEPDEYMHFLQLRTIFANFPNFLDVGLSVWAKPLYAYPLALIVQIFNVTTLAPVQIINSLIVLFASFLVFKVLRRDYSFGVSLLALILVNVSFNVFRASVSAMTEPMFMLVLVASYYLLIRKKYFWAALLVGISPLGRIEGALFILIWFGYFLTLKLSQKQLAILFITLALPTFIWNFLGFLDTGNFLYLIQRGYPLEQGRYGFGGIMHYPFGFLHQESLITILFSLSFASYVAIRKKLTLINALPIFSAIVFILIQIVFWMFGMFGTAGLMRYFVCVIPFMIISFAPLVEALNERLQDRYAKLLLIAIIILIQLFATSSEFVRGGFFHGLASRPEVRQEVVDAGKWIKANIPSDELISADIPSVLYFAERDLTHANIDLGIYFRNGTDGVFIWTEEWGTAVHKLKLTDLNELSLLQSFGNHVYIFRRS